MTLEQHIEQEVLRVRQKMADADISSMRVDIEITGRTMTGDVKIAYRVGETYGLQTQAEAFCLEAAVDEFLRRKGWEDRNMPKAISFSPAKDEPF